MHIFKIFVGSVILALTLSGCMNDYNYSELDDSEIVIAVGDSFTAGAGTSANLTYPSVLGRLITQPMMTISSADATAADLVKPLMPYYDNPKVKLIILMAGFNDLNRGADLRYTTAAFTEIVKNAEKHKIAVMIIGMPSPSTYEVHPFYYEIGAKLPVIFEANALVDVLKKESYRETPSKLNADGYRALAEKIEARLRKEGLIRGLF